MEPLAALSLAGTVTGLAVTARRIGSEIRRVSHTSESLTDLESLVRGFSNSCDAVAGVLSGLPRTTQQDISNRDPTFWRNLQRSLTALQTRAQRLRALVRSIQGHRHRFTGGAATATRLWWNEQNVTDTKDVARDMQSQVAIMLTLLNTCVKRTHLLSPIG
jgi:hypothetical protein